MLIYSFNVWEDIQEEQLPRFDIGNNKIKYNYGADSKYIYLNKLNGVAPLVADPPRWNSTTRQNLLDS